jgi:hypothetical protein
MRFQSKGFGQILSFVRAIILAILFFVTFFDKPLASEKQIDSLAIESKISDGHRIIVIGEIHGTMQGPAYFYALVQSLLQKHTHVLVSLEMPDQTKPFLDSFFASNADAESTTGLLATPFWRREDQDGRSSEAMLGLLGSLAHLKQQNPGLNVIAIDHLTNETPIVDRDKNMAQSLRRNLLESPDDTVTAVLIGNFHNRRRTASDVEWKPNFLSYLDEDNTVSLTVSTSGGTAWICETEHQCHVRPWPPDRSSGGIEPGTITMSPPGTGHYDGIFFIGDVSASPPAVKQ